MELKTLLIGINDMPPYCAICNKTFARKDTAKYHIRHLHKICVCATRHNDIEQCYRATIHKPIIKHYYCAVCDKVIKSKLNKAYHDITQ